MKNSKLILPIILIAGVFSNVGWYDKMFSSSYNEVSYPKAKVDFGDFKGLVEEIESYREKRMISFDEFLDMAKDENTVILDARSANLYRGKHLKNAINLPFTDFTQGNLHRVIPDMNTRILIYCNNNFEGDQKYFATKVSTPNMRSNEKIIKSQKPIMLALNIPTYINLYGYGYRNIFELGELVKVSDKRLEFEGNHGSDIIPYINLRGRRVKSAPLNQSKSTDEVPKTTPK